MEPRSEAPSDPFGMAEQRRRMRARQQAANDLIPARQRLSAATVALAETTRGFLDGLISRNVVPWTEYEAVKGCLAGYDAAVAEVDRLEREAARG